MTTQTATWNGETGAAESIRSAIWWAAVTLKRAWSRRRTRIVLSDLDDHVLRDIGLSPRDIREPVSLRRLSVTHDSRLISPVAFGR